MQKKDVSYANTNYFILQKEKEHSPPMALQNEILEKETWLYYFPDNGIRIARMYKPDGTNITSDSKEALSTSLLETDSCQKKIRYWI